MRKLPFLLSLLFLTSNAFAYPQHEHQGNTPGKFDFYVFNLSWQPKFCASVSNERLPECDNGGRGFVVHGLWPQFAQGYPEYCSTAPAPRNPEQYLDVMPSAWLVRHEWKAHGTCSGLTAESYFSAVRKARNSIHIPPSFEKAEKPFTLTPAEVKRAFTVANPTLKAESLAVGCGNNNLTAVSVCLGKDNLTPTACTGLRDCRANSIKVLVGR